MDSMNSAGWSLMCKKDLLLSSDEEIQLLTEILNASEDQVEQLRLLAMNNECESSFRCAAVDRLAQIESSSKTVEFLQKLIDPAHETDEDLRTTAYEALRFLDYLADSSSGIAIRTRSTRLKPSDPSLRIQWLSSLDD